MRALLPASLIAALVLAACADATPPRLGDEDAEQGEVQLAATDFVVGDDGWATSPPIAAAVPARRAAAWLALSPDALPFTVEVEDDGTFVAMDAPYRAAGSAVLRADLRTPARETRFRVRATALPWILRATLSLSPAPSLPQSDAVSVETGRVQQGLDQQLSDLGVVSREAWGSRSTSCSSDSSKYRMAVHHTAGPTTVGGTYAGAMRDIQAYHMDGRGYCDMGYHFGVSVDGTIFEGRRLDRLGAHAGGQNTGNIGIVHIGCFDTSCANDAPTDAMLQASARLIAKLSTMYGIGINGETIKGHRDWPGQSTACPGSGLHARIPDLLTLAQSGGGSPECLANANAGGCDGTVVTSCDANNTLSSGDCGYYGATCSTAGGHPHCVAFPCWTNLDGGEDGTFCVEGTEKIGTCQLGTYSEGDCAYYGATCSEAGGAPHCVHPYCGGEDEVQRCDDDATLFTCTLGVPATTACAAGQVCVADAAGARCAAPTVVDGDESTDDGAGGTDDGAGGSDDGAGGTDDGAGGTDDGAGGSDDGADDKGAGDDTPPVVVVPAQSEPVAEGGCAQTAPSSMAAVALLGAAGVARRRRRPE